VRLKADAVSFVLRHGNAYERLYLETALTRALDQQLVAELIELQRADGGWPWSLDSEAASSIVQTARALELLLKVSSETNQQWVTDAVCFLLARQAEDGGWPESSELAECIPSHMPWISTTDSMTYATGDVINALLRSGRAEHPGVTRAVAFLRRTQNDEGGWSPHMGPGGPTGTDIASMDVIVKALVLTGEGKQSAILKWAAEAVLANWEDWEYPVSAASALNVMLRLGYAPDHSHVKGLARALLTSQQADGGWNVTGVGPSDAGQTAYCVKQLLKCGVEPTT
jgi:hypothetical protein